MSVAVLAAFLGLLGGLAYFAALKASLRLVGRGWLAVAVVARLLAATGLFWLAARFGPLPLMAALAGFVAARGLMLRLLGGVR